MAKVRRAWLIGCQVVLLSCAGCSPKGCGFKGAPVMMPAPSRQVARTAPVLPPNDVAPSVDPEVATVSPSSPSEPASPPQDAPAALSELPAEASPTSPELLHETFADAAGSIRWNRDGVKSSEGPPSERTIYFFNGQPEGGPLVMRVVEDNMAAGPDGQPGVLTFSWQELPPKLPYSGFTYLGGRTADKRLILPPLKQVKAASELEPFRLKFRHKAVNASRTESFSLTFSCRIEPLLSDPYNKRLDLGDFTVNEEWGSFEKSFAEGNNAEAFLSAISMENPASFKVTWSQSGPLTNYRSGDTLLIDEVVITPALPE